MRPASSTARASVLLGVGTACIAAALLLPDPYAPAFHPTNESVRVYQAAVLEAGMGPDMAPVFDIVSPGWEAAGSPPNIDVAYRDGVWLLDKAPGLTLLTLPVLRVLRWLGLAIEHNLLVRWLALALCAVPSVVASVALHRAVLGRRRRPGERRNGGRPHAREEVEAQAPETSALPWPPVWVLGFLAVVATPWALYAVRFFGHASSAAFAVGGAVLLCAPPGRWPPWVQGALAGLCLGLAVLIELPLALAAVAATATAAVVPTLRSRLPGVIVGGALVAFLLGAWNQMLFGHPLAFGYGFKWHPGHLAVIDTGRYGFGWPTWEALSGILFSRERGTLHLAPWLVLGIPGSVMLALDRSAAPGWRWIVPCMALGYPLWIAGFVDWMAGWSAGARHLLPALPFWAVGVWVLVARVQRWSPVAGAGLVGGVVGVALLSTWLMIRVSASLVYFPEAVSSPVFGLARAAWETVGPYPLLGVEGSRAAGLVTALALGGGGLVVMGLLWCRGSSRWVLAPGLAVGLLVGWGVTERLWSPRGELGRPAAAEARAVASGLELRLETRGRREHPLVLPLAQEPGEGPRR